MFQIPMFKAEKDAGIEHLTASVSYACKVSPTASFEVKDSILSSLQAKAEKQDEVLHYLKTILVTTGWNDNDDVFDRLETWAARHTPEDTPFNYQHQCDQIIGHVLGSHVIDADGNVVADDTLVDSLPCKFHIVTPAVLYKLWNKADLQERMDKILAEIAEGKWFVSMECYFRGFDYAVVANDGACSVVARNQETAFLTKHLRVYGGKGEYEGKRVGRVLRNITYSGKGLVEQPANPESIIFASSSINFVPNETKKHDFLSLPSQPGYSLAEENQKKMNTELEKQLADAKSEIESRDAAIKKAEAEVAKLTEALASLEDTKKTLLAKEAELKKVSEELEANKAAQKQVLRFAQVKVALGTDEADAEAVKKATSLTESLAGLGDEHFKSALAAMPSPAPKQTPAPLPPKATNKPAPMSGKADLTLEGATAIPEPALAAPVIDDGAEKVRLSVAGLFGYQEGDK